MKRIAISLLTCAVLAGCGSITHQRDVLVNGVVVAREKESAHGFLMKAAVENLSSHTKDGNYTHSFTAKGVQASGDTEMLKTAIESTGTAVGNAANKAK